MCSLSLSLTAFDIPFTIRLVQIYEVNVLYQNNMLRNQTFPLLIFHSIFTSKDTVLEKSLLNNKILTKFN